LPGPFPLLIILDHLPVLPAHTSVLPRAVWLTPPLARFPLLLDALL
jgi:hypothetical protein